MGLWKHIIPRKQAAFVLPCASEKIPFLKISQETHSTGDGEMPPPNPWAATSMSFPGAAMILEREPFGGTGWLISQHRHLVKTVQFPPRGAWAALSLVNGLHRQRVSLRLCTKRPTPTALSLWL